MSTSYEELDKLPLLTGTRRPISFPQTILDSRTVTADEKVVGEVIPLADGEAFFYGIETRILKMMLRIEFDEILNVRGELPWMQQPLPITVRVRESELQENSRIPEGAKVLKTANRREFTAKAMLSTSPAGIVTGIVHW